MKKKIRIGDIVKIPASGFYGICESINRHGVAKINDGFVTEDAYVRDLDDEFGTPSDWLHNPGPMVGSLVTLKDGQIADIVSGYPDSENIGIISVRYNDGTVEKVPVDHIQRVIKFAPAYDVEHEDVPLEEATPKPGQTSEEKYKGWQIRYELLPKTGTTYRGMAQHLTSGKMQPITTTGTSSEDVINKLKGSIDTMAGKNTVGDKPVTIDFNSRLVTDVIGHNGPIYARIMNLIDKPYLCLSDNPHPGFYRAISRHKNGAGQQSFPITGANAAAAGLMHARYSIGLPIDLADDIKGYPLTFHSDVYDGDRIRMGEPGITVSVHD